MDRKGKPKNCDIGSSQEESQGEDLISKLPDPLLCDILCHLLREESIRTSVLSKRWRNIWQEILELDLDDRRFSSLDAFISFVDKLLDSHKSWIPKLRLYTRTLGDDSTFFIRWIGAATRGQIKHLDVETYERFDRMPLSIYTCATLVHLRLCKAVLSNVEFVSLPCLRSMSLENFRYLHDATFTKLISGCPVLEDLMIRRFKCVRDPYVKVLQVGSRTLKRIGIDSKDIKAVIDAPLLQCLTTRVYETKNFEIINSDFSARLGIDVEYGENFTRHILMETPKIRDLVICGKMWKDIFFYSKSRPLLRFCYLSHLNAKYSKSSNLQMLPTILECCPKLESLILEMVEVPSMRRLGTYVKTKLRYSTVPQCLVSSLKFVELKDPVLSYERGMNLVRYFLDNSPILEKLKLDLHFTGKAKCAFRKQLDAMPRCSSSCQVHLL